MTTLSKTTITIDLYTMGKPFPYDEAFWNHLRETLAEDCLLAGVSWDEKSLTRGECAKEVENLDELLEGVETTCALCGEKCEAAKAHAHHGWTIGDECCWDARLRSVE